MQKIMFKGKKNKVNHHKQIFININFLKWLKECSYIPVKNLQNSRKVDFQ